MTSENAETKSPGIFVSHTHADKGFARQLASDLSRYGAHAWIDEAEIKLGDSLIEKIRIGIDEMDYLAVILSPDSAASEWVRREVDIAMNQEIKGKRVKVLPLLYRQCELPWFLEGKLYADFTTPEKYVGSLRLVLERLGLENTVEKHVESLLGVAVADWLRYHVPLDIKRLSIIRQSTSTLSPQQAATITMSIKELIRSNYGAFINAEDNQYELRGQDPDLDKTWDLIHVLCDLLANFAQRGATQNIELMYKELKEEFPEDSFDWKYLFKDIKTPGVA